jgi:5'/3'-nucleotidase SurE
MSEIGQVVVVAPDKPQSAMGHAITINNTLYLNKISEENAAVVEYSCSGTPVDCVKLAVNEILHQKPLPYTLWVYGKKAKEFKKGGVGEKIQVLLK